MAESEETYPMAYSSGFMPQQPSSYHRGSHHGRGWPHQRGRGRAHRRRDELDDAQLAIKLQQHESGQVMMDDAQYAMLIQQQEETLQLYRDQSVAKTLQGKDNHQLLDDDSAYAKQFIDLDHEAQRKKAEKDIELARQLQDREKQEQIQTDVALAQQIQQQADQKKNNSHWVEECEEDSVPEETMESDQAFTQQMNQPHPRAQRGRPMQPPVHDDADRVAADAAFAQSIYNRDVAYKRQLESDFEIAMNIAEEDKNKVQRGGTRGRFTGRNRPSQRGRMASHPNPNVNRLLQWTLDGMHADDGNGIQPSPGFNSGVRPQPGSSSSNHGNVVTDGAVGGTMDPYMGMPPNLYADDEDLLLQHLVSGNFNWQAAPVFDENDYEALWNLAEQVGEVKQRGMTAEEMNALPTTTYHSSHNASGDDNDCKICFENFEHLQKIRTLKCMHKFHIQCIDKWLKQNATCPICRVEQKNK